MLGVERRDVLAYAGRHDLQWVEDGSNSDAKFSRNYLRLEIVPRLSTRFPAAEAMLAAAARRFGEAAGLLDELACLDLGGHPGGFPLPVRILAGLSEARARNVLRYLLTHAGVRIPSEPRLSEALRQLLRAGPDRHPEVQFGNHAIVRRRGEVDVKAL
jgi:tRNA(Ile)-lysidine synthase